MQGLDNPAEIGCFASEHPFLLGYGELRGVIGPATEDRDLLLVLEPVITEDILGPIECRRWIDERAIKIEASSIGIIHRDLPSKSFADCRRFGEVSTRAAHSSTARERASSNGFVEPPTNDP